MTESYEDRRLTDTPKQPKITLNTAMSTNNQKKYFPGHSVADHKQLEEANNNIAGDEIQQQNENL